MNVDPGPIRCAACGRLFTATDEVELCILCGRRFCSQHILVRKGVSNCRDCEPRRRHLERGAVSDADEARVVSLLCRDLENTVGPGYEQIVAVAAARIRLFSSDDTVYFEQSVVDDVQQTLHDSFIDTSWPRCPAHPHHPLWYSTPSWFCDKTGDVFAQLGTLSYGTRGEAR